MTYPEFWRRYLAAHSDPRTRGLHYFGTSLAAAAIAAAGVERDWHWLLAAPVAGYALAWFGHFKFEHNRPETFAHPVKIADQRFSYARHVSVRAARRRAAESRRGREK